MSESSYTPAMSLTPEEQAILNGSQGEVMAKVLKTLAMYGDTFGADKFIPISGPGHLVTSFGISVMSATFELMDELINAGVKAQQPFTADPRPLDYENVPCSLLQIHGARSEPWTTNPTTPTAVTTTVPSRRGPASTGRKF